MSEIFLKLRSWVSLLPPFTINSAVEIVILAVFIYICLLWIKNTRAWELLKGILVIFAFTIFAIAFQLTTIVWLLERISTVAIIAAVIIFQPELRKALEQLGSRSVFGRLFPEQAADNSMNTVNEIIKASFSMSKKKTGALIVIEQSHPLREIEETGIMVDGIVTGALLINIFEKNTPLHDGAVVISHNRVTAATCYLPLSEAPDISKDYGTRHRAALGISEVTDSITIVVSEETGRVSVAKNGRLRTVTDESSLRECLPRTEEKLPSAPKFPFFRKGADGYEAD